MRADERTDPELLRVARVGLGALGIVTEVTLRCVPAFNLHAVETHRAARPTCSPTSDGVMHATDHVEFYLDARRAPLPGEAQHPHRRAGRPQSKVGYVRDKWIGENLAFGAVCRVGRRFPTLAPKVAKLVTSAAAERDADRSQRPGVLQPAPRALRRDGVRHPVRRRARGASVGSCDLVASLPFPPLFPIEVRSSAGDDIPLSTANGRASGWIAVHQYVGAPYEAYFQGVERIMNDYGGRPHWGKLHFQSGRHAGRPVSGVGHVPDVAGHSSTRRAPSRNAYTDRVLGPVRVTGN